MVRGVAHCPCCIVHFVHDRGEAAGTMCVSQDLGVVSSPRISIGPAGCRVNRHGYRAMTIPGSPCVCVHTIHELVRASTARPFVEGGVTRRAERRPGEPADGGEAGGGVRGGSGIRGRPLREARNVGGCRPRRCLQLRFECIARPPSGCIGRATRMRRHAQHGPGP